MRPSPPLDPMCTITLALMDTQTYNADPSLWKYLEILSTGFIFILVPPVLGQHFGQVDYLQSECECWKTARP